MITEFEIKFLNIQLELLYKKFNRLGAQQIKSRVLMRRCVFDFPKALQVPGIKQWIRVRDEGDKITLTLKQVSSTNTIEGTKESEVQVKNFEDTCAFLKACGFIAKGYQENYREQWTHKNIDLCIDTWPGLDPFLEIEGTTKAGVVSMVDLLGFNYAEGYFGPVDLIYEKQGVLKANELNNIPNLTFSTIQETLKHIKNDLR